MGRGGEETDGAGPEKPAAAGPSLVARVAAGGDLGRALRTAVGLLGGIERFVRPGERVLLKANFNSPDPPPASTDPAFIEASVALLREAGAGEIAIGASAGLAWAPTRKVLEALGAGALARRLGVRLIDLDEGEWVEVALARAGEEETPSRPLAGEEETPSPAPPSRLKAPPPSRLKALPDLPRARIARAALETDRLIYLPCLKTHRHARFSMSLKLTMGLLHPAERRALHASRLEEKIADLNLAVRPDLVLLDGRRCFVSGGPARGSVREPGLVLASADRVAADAEGVAILRSYRFAWNRLFGSPWRMPQISRAAALGLGARSRADVRVVRPGGDGT